MPVWKLIKRDKKSFKKENRDVKIAMQDLIDCVKLATKFAAGDFLHGVQQMAETTVELSFASSAADDIELTMEYKEDKTQSPTPQGRAEGGSTLVIMSTESYMFEQYRGFMGSGGKWTVAETRYEQFIMHAGNEAAELALQEYSNRYGQKMLAEMGLDPRFTALQGKPRCTASPSPAYTHSLQTAPFVRFANGHR
jgi:hypothetical protein